MFACTPLFSHSTAGRPAPGVAVRPFFHRATGAGSRGLSARSAVSTPKMAAGDKNGATVEVPSIAVEVTADAPSGELLIVALHAAASPSDDADDADGAEAENEEDKALSLPPQLAGLDASLSGALSELLEDATFSGSAGSSTPILRMPSGGSVKRVALVGLGKAGSPKVDAAYRDAGSFAIKTGLTLKAAQAVRMAFADLDSPTGLAAVAEGAHLAMFSDSRFKGTLKASVTAEKKREERLPRTLSLSGVSVAASDVSGAIGRGAALAAGVTLTKQLVAAPANVVTPTSLAETAQGIAAAFPDCECEILEQADCEALGMGSFLAVGRGSSEPPKFIHLTYKPAGASAVKKVCLVGKGITFDSGGYNIKAGAGSMIALMKVSRGLQGRRACGAAGLLYFLSLWPCRQVRVRLCAVRQRGCVFDQGGCTCGVAVRSIQNCFLTLLWCPLLAAYTSCLVCPTAFLDLKTPSLTWADLAPFWEQRGRLQSSSRMWRSTSLSPRARTWCPPTPTGLGTSSLQAMARPLKWETLTRVRLWGLCSARGSVAPERRQQHIRMLQAFAGQCAGVWCGCHRCPSRLSCPSAPAGVSDSVFRCVVLYRRAWCVALCFSWCASCAVYRLV